MKTRYLILVIMIAAIGISLFILKGPEPAREFTVEDSRLIAENFIRNSPTYKFDGFDLRYVGTDVMKCPYCWGFIFEFKSRHAGYGDRTVKILAEVITEHRAKVIVDHGKVMSAVIDDRWDEINQKFLDIPKDLIITLKRTECFGTCPAYELTVYGNGTVVYDGKNFVKIEGIRTTTLSEDKIRQLISEFEKIDYFSLNESYEKYMATDMPSAIISITIDGKTKTVRHYQGDFTSPKELNGLEDRIDEIVDSNQWVKNGKVSLTLNKDTYPIGESIRFVLNPEGQDVYSENFEEWQIYKFEDNDWKSIPTGMLFGCRPTDCINGMVIRRCIDPGMTKCHEVLDPVSDSWDQEYWTTEEKACGNQTYVIDAKSQVNAGKYKIRYNYATDSNCEKYSYVEKEFEIKPAIPEQQCTRDSDCGTGGCSGQVCTTAERAKDVITTCEFLPEYGCLRLTVCGCVEGMCQWRKNSAYSDCMNRLKSG